MLLAIVLCVIGFLLLYFGAEWLVKGASSIATSLKISPIVIGLTVVAFGTSAPEFVVSVLASVQDKSMIAVGNVIGSNICNIALVLGLSALFCPISSQRSVVTREIPLMLAISVLLLILSYDSYLSRVDGIILFSGIILYSFWNYRSARKHARSARAIESELQEIGYVSNRFQMVLLVVVGIAGVVGGAKLVVDSAEIIMRALGLSEKFIGLTVVAFGTSLPELATSVVAAMRKELDISLGNLVGSNVFNILSVLGAAAAITPITIPGGFMESGLYIDYLVMMVTSALPLVFMFRDSSVSRKEGGILLSCYAGYLAYLIYSG